jgi:hypothetical protein
MFKKMDLTEHWCETKGISVHFRQSYKISVGI